MDYYLPFFLCVILKRCNFILLTSLFFILKRPNFFSLESSLLHLGIPGGLVICAVISSIIPPTIVQLCVRLSGPSPFDCLFHQVIRWQSSVRIYSDVFMEKSFNDQILYVKNWAVYAYILKWDTLYTCILSRHIYTYASSTALFSISFCPTIRFKYAFFYT